MKSMSICVVGHTNGHHILFLSGPLASSNSCIYLVNQNASDSISMPENRAVGTSSQDYFPEVDGPADGQPISAVPRGILKHLSTSSSPDSLFCCLEPQNPGSLDSPPETCIDRKQVRFSPMVGRRRADWQNGKELGEHSLLDNDAIAPSGVELNSSIENAATNPVSEHRPLLSHGLLDAQEDDLNYKNEADLQHQETTPQLLDRKNFFRLSCLYKKG